MFKEYHEVNSLIVLQKQRGHDFKREKLLKASSSLIGNKSRLGKPEFVSNAQCRCCFRKFHAEEKRIRITITHVSQFEELTNVEFSLNHTYPPNICELCELDLEIFSTLRQSFISKQQQLHEQSKVYVGDSEEDFTSNQALDEIVKQDPFEVAIVKTEDSFEPVFTAITEVKNNSGLDILQNLDDILAKSSGGIVKKEKKKPESSFGSRTVAKLCLNRKIWIYHCDHCEFKNKKRNAMVNHLQWVHVASWQQVRSSKKVVEKQPVRREFCFHCGKFFTSLERHLKNISKDETFYCDQCNHRSHSKYLLQSHIRRVHVKVNEHQCDECAKKFFCSSDLKQHIENVHGDRNHACPACGKAFGSKRILQKHVKIQHKHGKKYACDFCSLAYTSANTLRYHRNYHLGNYEFQCEKCSKEFFNPRELKRHTCLNVVQVACEVPGCSSALKRYDSSVSHIKRHGDISEERKLELIKRAKIRWADTKKLM